MKTEQISEPCHIDGKLWIMKVTVRPIIVGAFGKETG